MKNIVLINLLIIVLFSSVQDVFSQYSDNHILYNPHQNGNPTVGRTMGGATVALPDSVPFILDNPAGIGGSSRAKVYFSFHSSKGFIDFMHQSRPNLKDQTWVDYLKLGHFTAALPVKLFHRHLTVAASINFHIPYHYKIKENFFQTQPEYKDHLKTAALGIGCRLTSKIKIGIGWTHWFSNRKTDTSTNFSDYLYKKTSQYSANLFNAGFQANITKRVSAGIAVYFPFQLTINQTEIEPVDHKYSFEQREKFNGGFRFGLADKLTASLTIGVEYDYQNKFSNHFRSDWDTTQMDYSYGQSITVGVKQKIQIINISFPFYITYRYASMPIRKSENLFYGDIDFNIYGSFPQFDKNAGSHSIEIGSNYSWSRFTIYTAVEYKQTGKYKNYPPPIT